jgi:hypothetical protein
MAEGALLDLLADDGEVLCRREALTIASAPITIAGATCFVLRR